MSLYGQGNAVKYDSYKASSIYNHITYYGQDCETFAIVVAIRKDIHYTCVDSININKKIVMDLDFGYGGVINDNNQDAANGNDKNTDVTNLDNGKIEHDITDVSIADLDNNNDNKDKDGDNKNYDDADKDKGDDNNQNLTPGTTITIGDDSYKVDENGNVLDANGNIFKEAKDVQAWLKEYDTVEEPENEVSITTIRDAIGIDITDDNDKPIQFDNTPEGVKAYVDAVIETARQEHYETAINTLYQKYPILPEVLNYYIANGNSLEGFGQMPDRSGITIDDSNEEQQESIIRTAWKEQGRKGDVESYIAYLKSSGTLLATAKEELADMQEADAQYRKEIEDEATRVEEERLKKLEAYWNGVHDVIKTRQIVGYQIPESIIISRDNQKISVTPEDFFNYIYRVDQEGKSAYERDLEKETPESRRDDEILRAYLKFVGGNYSNLVNMAINKEKVNELRLRAKERNKSTVRITKPINDTNKKDIDFGYN